MPVFPRLRQTAYIPIDPDKNRPTVEKQMACQDSLWREVQKLIRLRLSHPALQSEPSLTFLYAREQTYPFVYQRECEEECILVILNPGREEADCKIELPGWGQVIYWNHGKARYAEGVLAVPAASATFVKVR